MVEFVHSVQYMALYEIEVAGKGTISRDKIFAIFFLGDVFNGLHKDITICGDVEKKSWSFYV
jgi:hypothetical protein